MRQLRRLQPRETGRAPAQLTECGDDALLGVASVSRAEVGQGEKGVEVAEDPTGGPTVAARDPASEF